MALQVTQVKSSNGANRGQLATLKSLGLRRIRHTVIVPDRPEFRGMVANLNHLLVVEEVPDGTTVDVHATRDASPDDTGEPGVVGETTGPSAETEELLESQGVADAGADHAADVVQLTPQIEPARGTTVKGGTDDDPSDAEDAVEDAVDDDAEETST